MASPLAPFREALASAVARSQGLSDHERETLVRTVREPEPEHGDLALPCFSLAKARKERPDAVAKALAASLAEDPMWHDVRAAGPYLNVRLSPAALAGAVVPAARAERYGRSDAGRGRTVVIDFSSPNIAKPLGFHHIRSTAIGAALTRLHRARGWTVVGINYLGDWGKQFGLLATGFSRHGDPARRGDAKHLIEVYVRANREADVAALKAAIQRPETARAQIAALEAARAEPVPDEPKAKKKREKTLRGLERKLRAERGLEGDADPLGDVESWLGMLDAAAEKARAALPDAEAKDREARQFLRRMEDGDEAALAIWREFRQTSVEDFERVYERMNVAFDHIEGEAKYQDVLEATVEQVRQQPGTRESEGAEIVDLPYAEGEPPVLIKTRDGTTLYVTRDIAAARDRFERFSFDRSLYVVGADQSLHFQQLFRTLSAMGCEWADRCAHVPFGRMHGMSTRRGNIVFLDEVLDEAVQKARAICEASDKIDRAHLDETVEAIGVGAIVFGDLKNLRTTDYTFDWDDVLAFDGHTGPYVQFSHARTCSILRKAGGVPDDADLSALALAEERALLMALARYPDAVESACESFEPSYLARNLLDVARATASYLTAGNRDRSMRVLVDDAPDVRAARLALVDAVRNVLKSGLQILGLRAPEAM